MAYLALTRRLLLCGVSAFALPIGASLAPAHAGGLPPGTALTVEGGGFCPTGDDGSLSTAYSYAGLQAFGSTAFGTMGCGWTGRLGLSQERRGAVLGIADYWGIFVRHQESRTDHFSGAGADSEVRSVSFAKYALYRAQFDTAGSFDEERTVVDFEVGKDIGIGSGSKLRLFGGLRYAHYTNTLRAAGETQSLYDKYNSSRRYEGNSSFALRAGHSFSGIGPRLGLMGELPLFGNLFLTGSVSGSLLWGDHKVRAFASGPGLNGQRITYSDSDMVSNAEGEVGVGMPFLGTGGRLVVGARWEGWFDQSQFKRYDLKLLDPCACEKASFTGSGDLDRNNWGPFARLKIPLGPAPPP